MAKFKCPTPPVSVWEVSFMELSNKFTKSVFSLLSIDILLIRLILRTKVVTEEDALVVKSRHFVDECRSTKQSHTMFIVKCANLARNLAGRCRMHCYEKPKSTLISNGILHFAKLNTHAHVYSLHICLDHPFGYKKIIIN